MTSSVVDPEELFSKYPIIQRESFAKHLTQFLNTKADDGYVLNLNAEWGAGKTTFLKCWYNMLKEDHPVVYFDAWKSDFTHDAMLALLDTFHDQLMSPLTENKELTKKLIEKGSHFVKTAIPSLLVGYLKHKTGVSKDESLLGEASEHFGLDFAEKELGDAIKETMKAMLEQRNKVEGIKEFKNTLVELSKNYLDVFNAKKAPIYVLIDELDRCRPNYAIEVIECVKHFFDTKDFVFILSTDTEQLQHSIKAVYGEGFDSHSYLSRFFDRVVTLPRPSLREYIEISINKLVTFNHNDNNAPCLMTLIVTIFDCHGVQSIREINKIFSDIEVAVSQKTNFELLPILILSILNRKYKKHYESFKNKRLNPYITHEYSETRHNENTLELPNITNFVDITNSVKLSIQDMLHHLITLGGYESTYGYEQFNYDENLTKNNIMLAVRQYSQLFTTSPSVTKTNLATERIEYFKIIDMAGHFN